MRLVRALLADVRARHFAQTPEQLAMIETLGERLAVDPPHRRTLAAQASPARARRRPITGAPRRGGAVPNPDGGKR